MLYSIVTEVKGVLSAGDCVTYTILFAVMNVEFLEMSPDVVGFSLRGHVPAQVEISLSNGCPETTYTKVFGSIGWQLNR